MNGFLKALLIAIAAFALDQASKVWVLAAYDLQLMQRVAVTPFLNFVYVRNYGVNFGLLASDSEAMRWILAGFSFAVSAALAVWAWRTTDTRIVIGSGLLIGGALGNAVDRLRVGAVIDFINVDCCGIGNPYAFNIADAAIFVGALFVVWAAWSEDGAGKSKSTGREGGTP